MPITFPTSPTDGQTFIGGGTTYTYNLSKTKWSATNSLLSSIGEDLLPDTDSSRNLGSLTKKWKSLYLSANTLFLGDSGSISAGAGGAIQLPAIQIGTGASAVKLEATGGKLKTTNNVSGVENAKSGTQTVADLAAMQVLPSPAQGDIVSVTANNTVYMYTGAGFFKIATVVNESPTAITGVDGTYSLATDGSPTVINAVSSDPEGATLTWSYSVQSGSLTNGGGATATVVKGSGATANRFTITPTATAAYAGEFTLRFSATDGVNATNVDPVFTLAFTKAWATTTQQAQLSPSDGLANDKFGNSSAISDDGSVAFVGSFGQGSTGAGYFYTRSGATWTQQQKVSGTVSGEYSKRGALALSGNGLYAAVGTPSAGVNNKVEIYYYNGSTWTTQQTITPAGSGNTNFGYSVALDLDGDTIAVGAPGGNSTTSHAEIWTRSGTTWSNQISNLNVAALSSGVSVSANDTYYGNSVSLSSDGNDLIVSQDRKYIGSLRWAGMAFFYSRSGSTWSFVRSVQNDDVTGTYSGTLSADKFFGENVRMSGDGNTAIVVSRGYGSSSDQAGYAYVWVKAGDGSWSFQTTIVPSDASSNDYGGGVQTEGDRGVDISNDGNIIVYGSGYNDGSAADAGAVYVFTRDGTTWTQQNSKFYSTGIGAGDHLGHSVAISGDGNYIIAGAERNDTGASNRGSAYIIF